MSALKYLCVASLFLAGCEPMAGPTDEEPTLASSDNALSAVYVLSEGSDGKIRFYSGQPGINQEIANIDRNAPLSTPARQLWGWTRVEIPLHLLPEDFSSVELDTAKLSGISFWGHAPGGADMGNCMPRGTVMLESGTPNMSGIIKVTRMPAEEFQIAYKIGATYSCDGHKWSGSYAYDAITVEAK